MAAGNGTDWKVIKKYREKLQKKIKEATAADVDEPRASDAFAASDYKDNRDSTAREKDEKEYDEIKEKLDNKLEE